MRRLSKIIKDSIYYIVIVAISIALLQSCASKPKYRIGVSQNSTDGWRESLNNELTREMLFHDNAEITILSADDDNEKQASDIRKFINEGYDLIITSPREAEALAGVIDEAMDAGIPVVLFDRRTGNDNYTAFIGADNEHIGRLNGLWLANHVKKGKVAEIAGLKGATPTYERHNGFLDAIQNVEGLEYVGMGYGDWTAESGERVADSLLRVHPDLKAIFAQNDRMAIAAREAAMKHGRKDLLIIGVDATPSIGIKAVADSVIDATQIYPTGGVELIQTAMAILEGKPYKRETVLESATVIDKSNAELLMLQNQQLITEAERLNRVKAEADEYAGIIDVNRMMLLGAAIIVILLGVVIFMILRQYWARKGMQELLSRKNKALNKAVHDMEAANNELQTANRRLDRANSELKTANEDLDRANNELQTANEDLDNVNAELTTERNKAVELVDKLEEATQAKLNFFTNVSHDLRTPLTLIADPVDQMCEASNLTESQRVLMRLARKNCRILMRLINQILDFRKLESRKLSLNLTEAPLDSLFHEWADAFTLLARRHDIKYEVKIQEGLETAAIDVEKMERVIFNLLSNAFKYTQDNGTIWFIVRRIDDRLLLKVADTGRGMSAEAVGRVFERFYQVDQVRPKGSGIGLALSKAFIEEHGGTITVDSEEGKGTIFTVSLPVEHVASVVTESASILDSETVNAELDYVEGTDDQAVTEAQEANPDRECVLVIDDNSDMRALVKTILSPAYTVIEATGGAAGVRKAAKFVPDLVVCDVMMPDMDGNECCKRIKENLTTSHIPVLMLTACSLDEQRIEGYESGADGYMSKPFQSRVLLARVSSLIRNRRLLKESSEELPRDNERQNGETSSTVGKQEWELKVHRVGGRDIDSEFYDEFIRLLESNLSNPDLGVEEIADKMGMSRVQVYRKVKALTNYSPVEIMRNTRLKRAARLLSTTEKTVSEVAYEVGFSNPSYFAKCFRTYFGESPTDLQKRTTKM